MRPFQPKTSSFGFKLKRKKFYIESLHLPPDFEEDKTEKTTGCGTPAPSGGGFSQPSNNWYMRALILNEHCSYITAT